MPPSPNLRALARAAAGWLAPLGAVACLTLTCILTSWKREFWNDELYSLYLVGDPSFSHMLSAFGDAINNTPATYFLAGWGWAHIFGVSEMSLRLFSSLGVSVALLLFWTLLRKTYGVWPSFIGCVVMFLTSTTVINQNAEARMYGLYAALAAIALLQYQRLANAPKIGAWSLVGFAAVQAALVNTHLFGLFYSLAFLAAFVLLDIVQRRPRWSLYGAVVAGQLSLLFYAPSFIRQSQAGIPRAWMPRPTFIDLIELTSLRSRSLGDVFIVVGLLALLAAIYLGWPLLRRQKPTLSLKPTLEQGSLLGLALLMLAVPFGVWIVSITVKPIFWDRYMLPSLFGYGIVFAHAASVITTAKTPGADTRRRDILSLSLLIVSAAAVFANPILHYKPAIVRGGFRMFFEQAFDHYNLPVVHQSSGAFLEWNAYSPHRERNFFVLDREAALTPQSGAFGAQQYKHMLAWRRQYPQLVDHRVIESEQFLARFDRFLVLDNTPFDASCPPSQTGLRYAREWKFMECPKWLEMRILYNPAYRVTKLGDFWGIAVLMVEKNPPQDRPVAGLKPRAEQIKK